MDRKTDSVSVPGILGRMSPEALSELIFNIANTLVSEGKAGTLTADLIPPQAKFAVMRPKDRAHGDWASNAAMQLAKKAGMKPRDFAELFAVELTNADGIKSVEVVFNGGWTYIDHVQYGQMGQMVTAVPEPETYAMFLAGLGLMGTIARRRQNKASS